MGRFVKTLSPGQAFRIWIDERKNQYIDYRLIHVNECRAYVEPLHRAKKVDILEDSPGYGGRVSIAPMAECEIIDEELNELMKTNTTVTETTKKKDTSSTRAPRGADRKFEARKQERPVRQGTIRADLLAAIEGGESNIPKLMKKFGMSRSLLVAHVHEMWNCHGYGYSVTGDIVKIVKPVGGAMKSEPAKAKKAPAAKKKTAYVDPLADDDEDPLA